MYAITPAHMWVHRRLHVKDRERNIPAALLSILVIATLATALAQPRWFYLKGGNCSRKFIGVQEFFYVGYFKGDREREPEPLVPERKAETFVYHGLNEVIRDCVTPSIVNTQRGIIALCFFAILTSLVQFFFDTLGVMHKWLRPIRLNGIGSIISVFLCVTVIGLCYYSSVLMEHQQESTKIHPGTKVEIKFAISYFLVTAAGSIAVLAAAANLLRRQPIVQSQDHQFLLDDCQGSETFSVGVPHSRSWSHRWEHPNLHTLPPPPPYTP